MTSKTIINDSYKYGFHEKENYIFKSKKGLDEEVVASISGHKNEPVWMKEMRLKSYATFVRKPMPLFGADLSTIHFDDIFYYIKPTQNVASSWDDIPKEIKNTYDKIGIPEAEKKFLAGVSAQYESEVVYKSIQSALTKKGVIFLDMDSGLAEYPEIVKQYFGTIIPAGDNKFSALNTSVWSGGSFVYVPKGVKVELPLQAYFRINAANMGQFERTLIIAEEGSFVHYLEGCTAPIYTTDSLHSAVVEIIVKKGARVRYTTIQNWSTNVYNLVTKRARVEEEGTMEWIDGNLGCLAQGSTVTTPDGIKKIEHIKAGDQILSYDESLGQLCFRKVRAKRFSGKQHVHVISAGERKLRVTSNHPFYSYVYDLTAPKKLHRYKLSYIRADKVKKVIVPSGSIDYGNPYQLKKSSLVTKFLSRNQYVEDLVMSRKRKTKLREVFYTTDDIAWLFGNWLGDGNIEIKNAKTRNVVRWAKVGFSTPVTDRARDRLMHTVTSLIDVRPVMRKDGVYVAWHSKEFAELFLLNGFVGNARNKHIPKWIWSLPESQRLSFIAGYLDADGYVKNPRSFVLKSVNRSLLEDVASLLCTLGITSHLYTEFIGPRHVVIMGKNCVAHGSHQLVFPLDTRLIQYVSPLLRKKAKQCRPARLIHYRTIGRSDIRLPKSVEILPIILSELSKFTISTWDIEVEGTGNFISQGFIVHNSKLTMKYPSVYLMGRKARGEVLSIAYAGKGQHQDAGGKAVHVAPETTSQIISKSVSKDGGRTSYRGLVEVHKGAINVKSKVVCDALLLDPESRSDTYPTMKIHEKDVTVEHEATVSKIGDEQLFYLESRGIAKDEAQSMIVNGFIEPIVKELPLEYAVEMNRLIQLQMEGSVG